MNKKNILLSAITGIILIFAFPNFIQKGMTQHTSFFIWFAYIPLFYAALKEENEKAVLFYGLISGGIFYSGGLYWILLVEPMGFGSYPALLFIVIYFSFLLGGTLYASKLIEKATGISALFSLPVILTFAEYFREWFITGWPVLTPAQSQFNFIFGLQLLKITGVHGLNFLIFAVNTAAAWHMAGNRFNYKVKSQAAFAIFIFLTFIFVIAGQFYGPGKEKIKVAILQPDIDQNVEWDSKYKQNTMKKMEDLVSAVKGRSPDLYIWPETGFPGVLNSQQGAKLMKKVSSWDRNAWSVIGSDMIKYDKQGKPNFFNGCFLVDGSGDVKGEYAKHHLVPMGEYIPLEKYLNKFIKKVVPRYSYMSFSAGKKIEPLSFRDIKVGTIICYDSFFPEISSKFTRKGAQLLVHLSYETWYKNSPASAQIFTNAVLRAVENNLPIARCVASGISGFVDHKGRITNKTGLFTAAAVTEELTLKRAGSFTIYSLMGDWFVWLLLAVLAAFILVFIRNKKSKTGN